jgi:hypothetical protein
LQQGGKNPVVRRGNIIRRLPFRYLPLAIKLVVFGELALI